MKRFTRLIKTARAFRDKHRPEDFYYLLKARPHLKLVEATIDRDMFFTIRNVWRARGADLQLLKYFALRHYLKQGLARALRLGLDRARGPVRILDIGAGFGYFPYVARFFSHDVTVLDSGGEPLFDDTLAYFMVPKITHAPAPQQKLPELGGRYDLITGFDVAFNEIDRHALIYWGPEDWRYFLKDLLTNHLNPGGRIVLELDYAQRGKGGYSREIERVFRDMGGRIRGARVTIRRKGLDEDTF